MSIMGKVACDEETVVAMLDLMKAMPFTRRTPLVVAPGKLYQLLIEGRFIAATLPVAVHSAQIFSASMKRVVHELRRRGVHVEQSRRLPGSSGTVPPDAPPPNAFRVWCDEDALLDVVWRRSPPPPQSIDPPRKAGRRARAQGA